MVPATRIVNNPFVGGCIEVGERAQSIAINVQHVGVAWARAPNGSVLGHQDASPIIVPAVSRGHRHLLFYSRNTKYEEDLTFACDQCDQSPRNSKFPRYTKGRASSGTTDGGDPARLVAPVDCDVVQIFVISKHMKSL